MSAITVLENKIDFFKELPWDKVIVQAMDVPLELEEVTPFEEKNIAVFKDSMDWAGNNKRHSAATVEPVPEETLSPSKDTSDESIRADFDVDVAPMHIPDIVQEKEDSHVSMSEDIEDLNARVVNDTPPPPLTEKYDKPNIQDDEDRRNSPMKPIIIHENTHEQADMMTGNFDNDIQKIGFILLSKKHAPKMLTIVLMSFTVWFGFSLWTDYSSFQIAKSTFTPNSMKQFVQTQSTSIWGPEAHSLLREMEESYYLKAKGNQQSVAIKQYLKNFPDGRYADEVIGLIGNENPKVDR